MLKQQSTWERLFLKPDLPLYVAAFVATNAWLSAVTMSIGEFGFSVTIFTLNTLGFLGSWLLRHWADQVEWSWFYARILMPSVWIRLLILIFVLVPGFVGLPPMAGFFPAGAEGSDEWMIGSLFAWGHVLYSFSLISEGLLLFASVPGIAMFGLMATTNVNPGLLVAFLVFVGANLFFLSYSTLLHQAGPAGPALERPSWRRLRRLSADQGLAAALLLLLTGGLGWGLSLLLQQVSPTVMPIMLARWQLQDWYYQTVGNYTGFLGEFWLGTGPVILSDQPVMSVECAEALRWRGAVYDEYTGRAWRRSSSAREWAVWDEQTGGHHLVGNQQRLQGVAPRRWVRQVFRAEKQMPSGLFAAADPIRLVGPYPPWAETDVYGCIFARMVVPKGQTYEVYSAIPDHYPPEKLRTAPAVDPRAIPAVYLQLPLGTERLQALAREVAGDQPTPYDQALAIQQFLEENYTYGDIPPIPAGRDVAEYFLFESRQGVCDLFATAMALMARSVGIPARVATGFAPGQYDPVAQKYLVRCLDAHAWAELFFPGYGWLAFDPQARREGLWLRRWRSFFGEGEIRWGWLLKRWFSWALLTLLGGLFLYQLAEPYLQTRPWQRPAAEDHRGWVVRLYHQACHFLARRGYPRRAAQTPSEYLAALRQHPAGINPEALVELADLTRRFLAARYSPQAVTAQDVTACRARLKSLRGHLKRRPRSAS